jgi:hypothetical protein
LDFWTVVVALFLMLFGPKRRRKTSKEKMQIRALERYVTEREFQIHRRIKWMKRQAAEVRRQARELRNEIFGSH